MRSLFAFCVLAFAALAVRAGAQLTDSSPFLPAGNGGSTATSDGTSPELRGIMSGPGGMRFCIYDPAKKASQWLALNEEGKGIVIKSADPAHDTVLIADPDGRRMTLVLKEAKVVSAPSSAPSVIPSQGGVLNVVLNPTPEDEQRRLQAIAEEVRRRRLLREQAAQAGAGQPGVQQQR